MFAKKNQRRSPPFTMFDYPSVPEAVDIWRKGSRGQMVFAIMVGGGLGTVVTRVLHLMNHPHDVGHIIALGVGLALLGAGLPLWNWQWQRRRRALDWAEWASQQWERMTLKEKEAWADEMDRLAGRPPNPLRVTS